MSALNGEFPTNLWSGFSWDEFSQLLTVPVFSRGRQSLMESRVLESVKAGRRLPEARFTNLKVASKGQPSVYGAFSRAAS